MEESSYLGKLDDVHEKITILVTDMEYVKKHIEVASKLPIRVKVLESTVSLLSKIAWGVGSVVGIAVITAVLLTVL